MNVSDRRTSGLRFEASWEVLTGTTSALFPLGRTGDVARSGLRVVSRVPIRLRERIDLMVRLPNRRLAKLQGTAVWTRQDQSIFSAGVALNEKDVEWLSIVNELEHAGRRETPLDASAQLRSTPRIAAPLHASYGTESAEEYPGSVSGLSDAGLTLFGCEEMPEGTALQIKLVTRDGEHILTGCTVWGRAEETPSGYKMGVRLNAPGPGYLELIGRTALASAKAARRTQGDGRVADERVQSNLQAMLVIIERLRARDIYGAFGVSPSDSSERIEQAFRETMRRFHPARLPPSADDEVRATAQELFQRANEAREALRNSRAL